MSILQILLADDDNINLMVLERHLFSGLKKYDSFDFEISTAQNGNEALIVANSKHLDLILLDWEMPEMDGIEVLKTLKLNEKTSEIPVVMITSNTSSEHLKIAIEAGAVDFIRKPIDVIELIARVRSVIKIATSYNQIKQQNKEITEQKEQITASINYARRLQNTMLPSNDLLLSLCSDYFVLNIPKDIVSGDFYWASLENGLSFYVVADCTGHGVPGAMLSMIGSNLLNEIIKNKKIYSPELILEELHKGVRLAFNQTESISRDGMDMAIVVYDKQTKKLSYSGAMNNLLLINDNQFLDVPADKISIGGKQLEDERKFTKHEFDICNENAHFYIYTDGFYDQFGGPDFKKYLIKNFRELIFNEYQLPKKQQCENLKVVFYDWIKGHQQMDDIMIMGVKL